MQLNRQQSGLRCLRCDDLVAANGLNSLEQRWGTSGLISSLFCIFTPPDFFHFHLSHLSDFMRLQFLLEPQMSFFTYADVLPKPVNTLWCVKAFKEIRLLELNNRQKWLHKMNIFVVNQKRGRQAREEGKAEDGKKLEMRGEAVHVGENRRMD